MRWQFALILTRQLRVLMRLSFLRNGTNSRLSNCHIFRLKRMKSIFVGLGLLSNLRFDAAICSHFRRSSHSRSSATPKNRIQNFRHWNCTWSGMMTYSPEYGDRKRRKVIENMCLSCSHVFFFFLPFQKRPFLVFVRPPCFWGISYRHFYLFFTQDRHNLIGTL